MEKMWMRSIVALAVCLSVAACGKSKNSSPAPAAPAKNTNPAETKKDLPTPDKDKTPGQTPAPNGNGNGPANDKNGSASDKGANGTGGNDKAGHQNDSNQPRRLQEKPENRGGSGDGAGNSSAPETNNSDVSPSPAPVSSKRYTGAAPDGLRDFYTSKQNSLPAEQLNRNSVFASSILDAGLSINSQGQVQMTLTIGNSEKSQTMTLTGTRKVGVNKSTLSSNMSGVSGSLTCMDQNMKGYACDNSVGEVTYNNSTVQIIFRRSAVNLSAIFPDNRCRTQDCDNLYSLFRYTENHIVQANTVKSAVMDSVEVILGRSLFTVVVITNETEIMKMSGELLSQGNGTLDVGLDRTLSADDVVDPVTHQMRRVRYNDILNDVRLRANDGHGNLLLVVKMKMLSNGEQDHFKLYVDRKVSPVVGIVEPARAASN